MANIVERVKKIVRAGDSRGAAQPGAALTRAKKDRGRLSGSQTSNRRATASATRIPSTPADRMPPA